MIEEIRMENIPGTFNSDTAVSLADGTGLGVGRTSSYIVLGAVCLGVLSMSTGSSLRRRLGKIDLLRRKYSCWGYQSTQTLLI
jgi:hypothetical protein